MQLLDSRASRMSPNQALLTLHADYVGGQHANYRKWYSAAQLLLAILKTQVFSTSYSKLDMFSSPVPIYLTHSCPGQENCLLQQLQALCYRAGVLYCPTDC